MNKALSITALIISIVALGLGAHAHLNACRLADQALGRREAQIIEKLWPSMQIIYQDLLEGSEGYTGKKPETIDELFTPLLNIIESIGK